ncbi:peptidase M23 [Roseobacter cerasinus]|uniref:Peptidase M23 n=1 Tax=Roseobacter cerasinus TaxID=2602289 RepID=A0A640VMI3_9RHOB|nr:peptidoglycan DD-metalloendopeptidase family protein [Roseobacter cerasinus]GFE49249.1 peptidase M23 [Roseobacter cerasinus]
MFADVRWIALILLLLVPAGALAQQSPADRARAAMDMLRAASAQLAEAETARDRVRALTETIQAFEDGLSALRSGLRQAAIREAQLSAQLQARDAEIATLLAALQRIGAQDSPVALLHPGGPTGTARSGMLLAEMTPALNARASGLRRDLEDLQVLRALQGDAAVQLTSGLTEVQAARTALSHAIAERTPLPKRFIQDPVREAILLASAETLESFADGLSQVVTQQTPPPPSELAGVKGDLPLPVQGVVLRRAGVADAAGITRPGVILATRPQAIVTSPTPATIRYAGPLLNLGQVVILEPQAGVLFILAGLDVVYATAGEVIDGGAPLGLMGDSGAENRRELSTDGDDTGALRSETLYIEVRYKNTPEDPGLWFETDKNG